MKRHLKVRPVLVVFWAVEKLSATIELLSFGYPGLLGLRGLVHSH
ncbi:hypothetical protein NEOLI_005441 [Neolecta irregularis DAH-3]|uniref:Uncharacterized protein n=1 Tax=Neolecta irregularis (strain DAH-3) TaxID=1198029 RepID=A0A1U7LI19_NEOID|nr:hypothetical protein NEOLI_005441 [Neolecta irregularis DAH-3]|eukprot:OLL22171.1 hypothetical protein NEOLI_005441 [Neolecta irregularis DAH-3]